MPRRLNPRVPRANMHLTKSVLFVVVVDMLMSHCLVVPNIICYLLITFAWIDALDVLLTSLFNSSGFGANNQSSSLFGGAQNNRPGGFGTNTNTGQSLFGSTTPNTGSGFGAGTGFGSTPTTTSSGSCPTASWCSKPQRTRAGWCSTSRTAWRAPGRCKASGTPTSTSSCWLCSSKTTSQGLSAGLIPYKINPGLISVARSDLVWLKTMFRCWADPESHKSFVYLRRLQSQSCIWLAAFVLISRILTLYYNIYLINSCSPYLFTKSMNWVEIT